MVTSTNELTKELVNKKLMIFCKFQANAKNIKCPLEWWKNLNLCSQLLVFFSRQILGIIGSQNEIEKIFSLTHIFTNLKKCHL
jgi:hypothetical protein